MDLQEMADYIAELNCKRYEKGLAIGGGTIIDIDNDEIDEAKGIVNSLSDKYPCLTCQFIDNPIGIFIGGNK